MRDAGEILKSSIFWKIFSRNFLEGVLILIPLFALVQLTVINPYIYSSGDVYAQSGEEGIVRVPVGENELDTRISGSSETTGIVRVPIGETNVIGVNSSDTAKIPVGENSGEYNVDGYPDSTIVRVPTGETVPSNTYQGDGIVRVPTGNSSDTVWVGCNNDSYNCNSNVARVPIGESAPTTYYPVVVTTPRPAPTIYVRQPQTTTVIQQPVRETVVYNQTQPQTIIKERPQTIVQERIIYNTPYPTPHRTPIPITVLPYQQYQNQYVNVSGGTVPVTTTTRVVATPVAVTKGNVVVEELPRTGPAILVLLLGTAVPLSVKLRNYSNDKNLNFSPNSVWQGRELKK